MRVRNKPGAPEGGVPGARGRGAGPRAASGQAPELCVLGRQAPTRHWAIRQPDRGPLGQTAPRDTPQLPMSRCLPKPETTPASEPQPHLRRPQGQGTDPARGAGARATRFPPEKRRLVPRARPPWPGPWAEGLRAQRGGRQRGRCLGTSRNSSSQTPPGTVSRLFSGTRTIHSPASSKHLRGAGPARASVHTFQDRTGKPEPLSSEQRASVPSRRRPAAPVAVPASVGMS